MSAAARNISTNSPIVPGSGELGTQNCVLIARARRHSVREFPGPLSIKTVTRGRVAWRLNRRDIWVDPSCFLVLNCGEPYSMDIGSSEPVATCCAFFQKGFVEALFRDSTHDDAACLDDPEAGGCEVLFLSRLRPVSAGITRAMRTLEQRSRAVCEQLALDELYCDLAAELLRLSGETRCMARRIPAARASTRAELLKRVSRGRELLHACNGHVPTLAEAARAAAMSPFHFQRTFQRAFGTTPSGYLARLRFERALALLATGAAVTDVAFELHYAGTAAFSAAFRKRLGIAPSRYAAQFSKKSKAPSCGLA